MMVTGFCGVSSPGSSIAPVGLLPWSVRSYSIGVRIPGEVWASLPVVENLDAADYKRTCAKRRKVLFHIWPWVGWLAPGLAFL